MGRNSSLVGSRNTRITDAVVDAIPGVALKVILGDLEEKVSKSLSELREEVGREVSGTSARFDMFTADIADQLRGQKLFLEKVCKELESHITAVEGAFAKIQADLDHRLGEHDINI